MNVLVVDDHPMIIDGYINVLSGGFLGSYNPLFTKAHNCEEAYFLLLKSVSEKKVFDIAIIDKGLPAYEAKSISSGNDLALFIREKMPTCKIIIITAHTEVIIIYDIVKQVRPDGIIIKNDMTPEKLNLAIIDVLRGIRYHSPMVKRCINEIWRKELMFEDSNRQILFYLAKGFKINELAEIIHLTTSAIQKRIMKMKDAFEAKDNSGLVREAIKKGFI